MAAVGSSRAAPDTRSDNEDEEQERLGLLGEAADSRQPQTEDGDGGAHSSSSGRVAASPLHFGHLARKTWVFLSITTALNVHNVRYSPARLPACLLPARVSVALCGLSSRARC
jgi:hypothetical protein